MKSSQLEKGLKKLFKTILTTVVSIENNYR